MRREQCVMLALLNAPTVREPPHWPVKEGRFPGPSISRIDWSVPLIKVLDWIETSGIPFKVLLASVVGYPDRVNCFSVFLTVRYPSPHRNSSLLIA